MEGVEAMSRLGRFVRFLLFTCIPFLSSPLTTSCLPPPSPHFPSFHSFLPPSAPRPPCLPFFASCPSSLSLFFLSVLSHFDPCLNSTFFLFLLSIFPPPLPCLPFPSFLFSLIPSPTIFSSSPLLPSFLLHMFFLHNQYLLLRFHPSFIYHLSLLQFPQLESIPLHLTYTTSFLTRFTPMHERLRKNWRHHTPVLILTVFTLSHPVSQSPVNQTHSEGLL